MTALAGIVLALGLLCIVSAAISGEDADKATGLIFLGQLLASIALAVVVLLS